MNESETSEQVLISQLLQDLILTQFLRCALPLSQNVSTPASKVW